MADEYLEGIMNRENNEPKTAARKPSVYLAGPEVFLPEAIEVGALKKNICAKHGLVGHYPLDNELSDKDSDTPLSLQIYRANIGLMGQSDAIIANLTPFRGPGADGGTVFELGYMIGQGKASFGYSNLDGEYRDKAINTIGGRFKNENYFDDEGLLIENFGLRDNLMIEYGAQTSGLDFEVVPTGQFSGDKWSDMRQFESLVIKVAAFFTKS
jgi:nucleoside 2-deoxyribosyltransferase